MKRQQKNEYVQSSKYLKIEPPPPKKVVGKNLKNLLLLFVSRKKSKVYFSETKVRFDIEKFEVMSFQPNCPTTIRSERSSVLFTPKLNILNCLRPFSIKVPFRHLNILPVENSYGT